MAEFEKIEKESNSEPAAVATATPPEKKKRGGFRPNSGRKAGKESDATKQRRIALEAYRNRVANNMMQILDGQLANARGLSFLYRIDTETVGSGKNAKRIKKKPVIVEDPYEIQAYLNGDYDDDEDSYYYITTKAPDNKAADSMLDRTYGRPEQAIDHKVSDENGLLAAIARAAYDMPDEMLDMLEQGDEEDGESEETPDTAVIAPKTEKVPENEALKAP